MLQEAPRINGRGAEDHLLKLDLGARVECDEHAALEPQSVPRFDDLARAGIHLDDAALPIQKENRQRQTLEDPRCRVTPRLDRLEAGLNANRLHQVRRDSAQDLALRIAERPRTVRPAG